MPLDMDKLKSMAESAVSAGNADESDKKYAELIATVGESVSDNERAMAVVLQELAQNLELSGKKELAFDFKQKTCAAMLEWSMGIRKPERK